MPKERSPEFFGNYRTFPQEYMKLLELVERLKPGETFQLGPFTKAQALAARRSFYRFRVALDEAATLQDDKRDDLAREMSSAGHLVLLRVEPVPDTDQHQITFALNPVVDAIRRLTASTG